MRVICEQHRDGVPDEHVTEIPELRGVGRCGEEIVEREGETPAETMERKLLGARYHGWSVELTADGFHAWKEYGDGDGTPERPHRVDRYFRMVP